jgi:hypothetical protein
MLYVLEAHMLLDLGPYRNMLSFPVKIMSHARCSRSKFKIIRNSIAIYAHVSNSHNWAYTKATVTQVSIESDYKQDHRGSIPAEAKDFFL